MKKLLLILLFLPAILSAQEYSEVVTVEGKTADELYDAAHEWMAVSFNSANDVIQLEDPVNKKLIAKGIKVINHEVNGIPSPMNMYFTLITEFKEGRYRYQITPTTFKSKAGIDHSYELLQDITTEEGLITFYKKNGLKPGIIGKKQIAKNVESNKILFTNINLALKKIPASLKQAIIKTEKDNDW